MGSRGLSRSFLARDLNYILKLLYLGCQWKELPIEKNKDGRPETHYIRIYRAFSYEAHGCFDTFLRSVCSFTRKNNRHQRHPRMVRRQRRKKAAKTTRMQVGLDLNKTIVSLGLADTI